MSCSNPRRRTPVTRPEDKDSDVLTLKTNMVLRKSSTFHSPNSPVAAPTEAFIPPPLIRRSQTNLDDVVDAHRRRVALTLHTIDKSLSKKDLSPSSSPKKQAFRDTSLPVPRGFLSLPIVDPAMAKEAETSERRVLRPRRTRPARHESDSGLGSSIVSSKQEKRSAISSKTQTRASAITRSAAASSSTMENLPGLGSRAVNRIHEHVLRPLRAKPSLKDFEPIVVDIPRRIQEKEIICLRDLEKTLIFMAPERTKTANLYLDFCLTSIRCIQATVEYLNDREQTRPSDRPYTNGYFIDLVAQIRQYAADLAAAEESRQDDEADDEMDLDPTDEVKLFGGIAENGRPAELVRIKKDGKAISMATGDVVDMGEDAKPVRFKRSMSQELEDDEEIMRSMARRKKNASPDEYAPKKCREPGCNKEFKRPCDLTKHEKTHSRPWKCPVPTCKYHEYGWPTEKEMDRHHNDKHSATPPMYECLFKPCPYKSKRESNCKQHMEKAHDWTYVRTKTNGKKGHRKADSTSIPMPISNDSTGGITTPPDEDMSHISIYDPTDLPPLISQEEFQALVGPVPPTIDDIGVDFSPLEQQHTPSTEASYPYSTYQEGPDFTINEDIYSAHAQLPTPDHSAYGKIFADMQPFHHPRSAAPVAAPAPHISPIGQGNAMLYTPNSLVDVDEGFEDFPVDGGMGRDFQLFPSVGKAGTYESLFNDVPSAGMGFSQPSSQDLFPQPTMDWQSQVDFTNYHQHP